MGRRSHRAKPCAVTTPDPDTSALALRAQNSWRPTSWTESVRAVLLIGLLATFIYALVAHGGFFRPASTVILATALVTVALSILLSSNTRSLLAEDIALLGLAGWWLASAQLHHSVGSFVPLGASIVAFWASSMVVRDAPPHWKVVTNYVLVLAGAATALLGLVGCAVRWYPIAMRGQNIWRLSGTMTYSNAAGLLLAMTLLLSMSSLVSNRWRPLLVAVNAAGLVATESRGAVVAFILGAAFCARRECKGSWLALSSGVAAGLVMVARSTGHPHQVGALVISLVIVLLAAYSHPLEQIVKSRLTSSSSRYVRRFSVPAVTLANFLVLGFLVRRQLVHRIDVGSNLGRLREWRAALRQFWSSPWIGRGPDQALMTKPGTSLSVHFAHNEYLQILAGGGVIGFILLLLSINFVATRLRQACARDRIAQGALVVFLVGGFFDFTWHLPVLGLCAGLVVALVATPN